MPFLVNPYINNACHQLGMQHTAPWLWSSSGNNSHGRDPVQVNGSLDKVLHQWLMRSRLEVYLFESLATIANSFCGMLIIKILHINYEEISTNFTAWVFNLNIQTVIFATCRKTLQAGYLLNWVLFQPSRSWYLQQIINCFRAWVFFQPAAST